MKRYDDSVASKITGLPVNRAQITVYTQNADGSQGVVAQTYLSNSGTILVQPIYTTANGEYFFYVADGTYQISVSVSGETPIVIPDIQIYDDVTDRALTARAIVVPAGESGGVLPPASTRAGNYLYFDVNGVPTVGTSVGSGAIVDGLGSNTTAATNQSTTTYYVNLLLAKVAGLASDAFITPTLHPGHAYGDFTVPANPTGGAGDGFVDNIMRMQNNSVSTGGVYGNAAISFADGAGTERGAVGYSRNAAIQPNGYDPNTMYIEIGNPFTTDASTTDFEVVTTLLGGGPEAPGTTVHTPLLTYNHASARWDFRTHKLPGSVNSNVDFNIGYPNQSQYQLLVGGTNAGVRVREYLESNFFSITSNCGSMLAGGAIIRDVTAGNLDSWRIAFGSSASYNEFSIHHSASGASAWTQFFKIDNSGYVIIPPGLGNYTSDSAAASGGVPVNALYRNGSAVQIRVS